MKRVVLVATLCIVGLVSAKEGDVKSQRLEQQGKVSIEGKRFQPSKLLRHWIKVVSTCGKVYYLDSADYQSFSELESDVQYFDVQKCPTIE